MAVVCSRPAIGRLTGATPITFSREAWTGQPMSTTSPCFVVTIVERCMARTGPWNAIPSPAKFGPPGETAPCTGGGQTDLSDPSASRRCSVDCVPNSLGRARQIEMFDPKVGQRVDDGVVYCWCRADGARFADAFEAKFVHA